MDSLRRQSCPGHDDLVCYDVTPYCTPGPRLMPLVWVKRPVRASSVWRDRGTCPNGCVSTATNELLKSAITCPGMEGLLCILAPTSAVVGQEDWGATALIVATLVFVLLAAQVSRRVYSRKQAHQEARSVTLQDAEEYVSSLMKRMCPSASTPHRFQGIHVVPEGARISLAFEELSCWLLENRRCILADVSGELRANRMAAILGPSGSGKTTFMNVLCGKATYGVMSGKVLVNGEVSDIRGLKSVVGFVPQDDIVHRDLTVREQIYYAARLRNPAGTTNAACHCIVEDVMAIMKIRHIQHSVVGDVEARGISGGQRKRVNIGLELAACPYVLFLDEPTSGLDATSALGIIHSLKTLTELGMTIVMTIHQPRYSLFELFDDALLLGVGGRTVYMGSAVGVKPYLEGLGFMMKENENPADWFMDVISGEVENSLDTSLKPEKLFEVWNTKRKDLHRAGSRHRSRHWGAQDDRSIIRQLLSDEWDKCTKGSSKVVGREALRRVLSKCAGAPPSTHALEELRARMEQRSGGRGAEGVGFITKRDFVEYFVGLSGREGHDSELADLRATTSCDEESFERPLISGGTNGFSNKSDGILGRCFQCGCSLFSIQWVSAEKEQEQRKAGEALSRTRPSFSAQFMVFLERALVQWWRQSRLRAVNYCLVCASAVILGLICRGHVRIAYPMMPLNIFLAHTVLALLTAVSCLRVFGANRPVFWRESAGGVNILSYYFASVTVDAFDVASQCVLFVCCWYWASDAYFSIFRVYLPSFALVAFVGAGWGYSTSTLVEPQSATLAVAVVIIVLGCCPGMPSRVAPGFEQGATFTLRMSMFVWSTAMCYVGAIEREGGPDNVPIGEARRVAQAYLGLSDLGEGYLDQQQCCKLVLATMGVSLQVAAFLGLRFFNRDKQV